SAGAPAVATLRIRGPWRGEIETTEAGQWEVLAIAGTYEVVASSEHELPCAPIVIAHDGTNRTDGGVVRTVEGAELAITVVDDNNAPSPDAIVFLADVTRGQVPRLWRTDDVGCALGTGIPPGAYKVWASTDDDSSQYTSVVLDVGHSDVQLV